MRRSAIWSESGEVLIQLGPAGAGIAVVSEDEQGRRARAVMLGDTRDAHDT